MRVTLGYLGKSRLVHEASGQLVNLVPNLVRDPVAFDAQLSAPLRFREAISTLHDVVTSDLRFHRRDRTAYLEWKKQDLARQRTLRRGELKKAQDEILARRRDVPRDLAQSYSRELSRYWKARQKYATYLRQNDPAVWRLLMPCDPIVTVSSDVVFFECFSADESSYGCLSVDRDGGFGPSSSTLFGTTNVDFSWELFHHFQDLRSYRNTRLRIDPSGFEVKTDESADYREEKIDLPDGWLRGFTRLQAAMGFPGRSVTLSREAVYSILAWLKRHKAKTSPRALRFELLPGKAPRIVLEPWEQEIVDRGSIYDGPPVAPIRIWGRQRLLTLARLLPLAERFDVHLLGTGLPSFWIARMGEMRFTLGLSGWTTNDWTRGSALDLLAPPVSVSKDLIEQMACLIRARQRLSTDEIRREITVDPAQCAAALNHLALVGQVIHDLPGRVFRWRQIMPMILGEEQVGPENEELVASREIMRQRGVRIESFQEPLPGCRLYLASAGSYSVEMLLDADGRIKRGRCGCSHHHRGGLRMGPCRHLQAVRWQVLKGEPARETGGWSRWFEPLGAWTTGW